jgi:hypothetical protein
MVDKANGNSASYGTGSYATKQVVDTVAVNDAVNRLIVPGGKFVAIASNSDKAVGNAIPIRSAWNSCHDPSNIIG